MINILKKPIFLLSLCLPRPQLDRLSNRLKTTVHILLQRIILKERINDIKDITCQLFALKLEIISS